MAINITSSEMNMFYGTNSILLLTAIANQNESSESIHLYTNYFSNETNLVFQSKSNKRITLSVRDISAKNILSGNYSVMPGFNLFKISIQTPGLYVITLLSDSFIGSEKIILSHNFSNHSSEIVYEGIKDQTLKEKSVTDEQADLYHFYIYSGDMITKIADRPSVSKTYNVA